MRILSIALVALCTPLFGAERTSAAPQEISQWVRSQGGEVVSSGGHITGVKLNFDWVSDADVDRLATLRDLRTLDLSLTLLTDAGIEKLKPLTSVTDLNLYAVERITDVALAYLRGWSKLERLNLRGTDVTDTSLQYISTLPALRSLDVSHTQVTNNGMEYLPSLRTLEELYVGGNKVTGIGLRWLKTLPNLRLLDLHGGQKRNSGIWSVSLTDLDLAILGGCRHLQDLNLAGMPIGDAGLPALTALRELRVLDLSRTQVSGKGLAELGALENLDRLSLWQAGKIDDNAAAAFAAMHKLQVLDLSETKITDQTLSALGRLPALRKLYLAGTNVTAAGVETFTRSHANCEVSWK